MTGNLEPEKNTRSRWGTVVRLAFGVVLVVFLAVLLVSQFMKTSVPRAKRSAPSGEGEAVSAYRETERIATGLAQSRGIAIDAKGNLYVAGDRRLARFDVTGTQLPPFALSGDPYCVTVAGDGTIYVGMRDHVEVYARAGTLRARWESLGSRARLTSLALMDGDLWVADAGNRVIRRFQRNGKNIGELGRRDATRNIPGLVVPSPHLDVASGSDHLLRVANPGRHCVEMYTAAGDLKESWGEASMAYEGFSGCCNPTDIALFPDGRVITAEKGIARVKVSAVDGRLESIVATPKELSPGVVGLDLALDARGRIYVLDPGINAVRIFARKEGGR